MFVFADINKKIIIKTAVGAEEFELLKYPSDFGRDLFFCSTSMQVKTCGK